MMKKRNFVMGDIHGACRALKQCLERSAFDYNQDTLICLGDVADGWPETRQAMDELLRIKNLVYIFGNHDFWTLEWMLHGHADDVWLKQGGLATVNSYPKKIPKAHVALLEEAHLHYVDDNKLFVHAGIDPLIPLEAQSMQTQLWSRDFANRALGLSQKKSTEKITSFNEVFIGHTPQFSGTPVQHAEVWFMDTGAGWHGVLSMMDIDTKEIFTSDPVLSLYPGVEGRKKFT